MRAQRLTNFSWGAAITAAILAVGCGDPRFTPPDPDATPGEDAPVDAVNNDLPRPDVTPPPDVAPPPDVTPPPDVSPPIDVGASFCAVVRCASGTRCCEALRMCIPAASPCPGDPPPIDGGTTTCATAADCGSGRECVYPDAMCARSGTCMAAIACLRAEPFCSCTGVTFSGCRPDRPTQSRGACPTVDAGVDTGVDAAPIACSSDRDCLTGQSCCTSTNRCYDSRCLACCMPRLDAGPPTCRANSDCASGQYCSGAGCDTAGTCAARPGACTLEYSPVCGCDGRTYGNACAAASAGVRVSSRGECVSSTFCATALCAPGTRCCEARRACQPAGVSCPTDPPDAGPASCVSALDCGFSQECVYPDAMCARSGTCTAAIACLRAEPFCACTGATYSACRPDRPTQSRGACPTIDAGVDAGPATCSTDRDCATGQACCSFTNRCYPAACLGCCMFAPPDAGPRGCTTVRDCASGQECVYASTACATSGTCTAAIACLRAETFCSCAGATYMGCRPDRSTRSTGACAVADAGTPGCRTNADCRTGQYCAGTGCDTVGACAARPEACATIYSPVCGCDRRTYGNECSANAAGVRAASRGVCP